MPPSEKPPVDEPVPPKQPVPPYQSLGMIRDYLTVQMEQDDVTAHRYF